MSWNCGECGVKWPEAVPSCIRCLSAEGKRYREALERITRGRDRGANALRAIAAAALHPAKERP